MKQHIHDKPLESVYMPTTFFETASSVGNNIEISETNIETSPTSKQFSMLYTEWFDSLEEIAIEGTPTGKTVINDLFQVYENNYCRFIISGHTPAILLNNQLKTSDQVRLRLEGTGQRVYVLDRDYIELMKNKIMDYEDKIAGEAYIQPIILVEF